MCNTKIPNMLIYLATISSEAFTSAVGRLTQTLRGVGQSRTPKWHDGANEKRGRDPKHPAPDMFMKVRLGVFFTAHLILMKKEKVRFLECHKISGSGSKIRFRFEIRSIQIKYTKESVINS